MLTEMLQADARAPAGAKIEKGFESIAAIVVNTLWCLHIYHLCLNGSNRKFNIGLQHPPAGHAGADGGRLRAESARSASKEARPSLRPSDPA
jgi:hypothetical protein